MSHPKKPRLSWILVLVLVVVVVVVLDAPAWSRLEPSLTRHAIKRQRLEPSLTGA
jgi:hypothetical protein